MASLYEANTTFALDMYKKLAEEKKGCNIFYSPISISAALSMVVLGARGNTAAQMTKVLYLEKVGKAPGILGNQSDQPFSGMEQQRVMQQKTCVGMEQGKEHHHHHAHHHHHQHHEHHHHSPPQKVLHSDTTEDVHSGFQELTTELNNPSAVGTLKMANRLFGEQTYNFSIDYIAKAKKFYHAELEALDFIGSPDPARIHINEWVEGQTAGKIQNLLASGTIDSLTRLVLVNAVYFKCNWDSKFKESNTQEVPFRLSKTETKPVRMMSQKDRFNYAFIPDMQIKIIELPYVNNEKNMYVILPLDIKDDTTGLELVEKNLTFQNLVEWTNPQKMNNEDVRLSLPKFKLEDNNDLKTMLMSMGMVDAFSQGKADFSGMSGKKDLCLSKVVHKAFVDVNEEGTEAAAATAAVIMLGCAQFPLEFYADHPFIFFIKESKTSCILFVGRVCSP